LLSGFPADYLCKTVSVSSFSFCLHWPWMLIVFFRESHQPVNKLHITSHAPGMIHSCYMPLSARTKARFFTLACRHSVSVASVKLQSTNTAHFEFGAQTPEKSPSGQQNAISDKSNVAAKPVVPGRHSQADGENTR
jgi:hypothetical protein